MKGIAVFLAGNRKAGKVKTPTWSGRKLEGRCRVKGLEISIENDRGSFRSGVDFDGKPWRTRMRSPYGYIRRVRLGTDNEHLDCYLGPEAQKERAGYVGDFDKVWIVHARNPETGKYDEDKVMLGYQSRVEAIEDFKRHYDDSSKFLGPVTEMSLDKFKEKIKDQSQEPKRLGRGKMAKGLDGEPPKAPEEKTSSSSPGGFSVGTKPAPQQKGFAILSKGKKKKKVVICDIDGTIAQEKAYKEPWAFLSGERVGDPIKEGIACLKKMDGVEIHYLTGRAVSIRTATEDWLKHVGAPNPDNLHVRPEAEDVAAHKADVTSKLANEYDVIVSIGNSVEEQEAAAREGIPFVMIGASSPGKDWERFHAGKGEEMGLIAKSGFEIFIKGENGETKFSPPPASSSDSDHDRIFPDVHYAPKAQGFQVQIKQPTQPKAQQPQQAQQPTQPKAQGFQVQIKQPAPAQQEQSQPTEELGAHGQPKAWGDDPDQWDMHPSYSMEKDPNYAHLFEGKISGKAQQPTAVEEKPKGNIYQVEEGEGAKLAFHSAKEGGVAEGSVVTHGDHPGGKFLLKPTTPMHEIKLMAETAGSRLAKKVLGDRSVAVRPISLAGAGEDISGGASHGVIQPMVEHGGTLPLNKKELLQQPKTVHQDLMTSMVSNWLVSDHDAHGGQYLLTPDKQNVTRIDYGQSYKYLGKDQLHPDYHPNKYYEEELSEETNKPSPMVLLEAYRNGEVDLDLHDPAIVEAIQRAESISDEEIEREVMPYAMGHAKDRGTDPESIVEMAIARKDNIREDFRKLFSEVESEREGRNVSFRFGDEDESTGPDGLSSKEVSMVHDTYEGLRDMMEEVDLKSLSDENRHLLSQPQQMMIDDVLRWTSGGPGIYGYIRNPDGHDAPGDQKIFGHGGWSTPISKQLCDASRKRLVAMTQMKLPEAKTLYRGMNLPLELSDMEEGGRFNLGHVASFSGDKDIAHDWVDPRDGEFGLLMAIHTDKAGHLEPLSELGAHEQEFIVGGEVSIKSIEHSKISYNVPQWAGGGTTHRPVQIWHVEYSDQVKKGKAGGEMNSREKKLALLQEHMDRNLDRNPFHRSRESRQAAKGFRCLVKGDPIAPGGPKPASPMSERALPPAAPVERGSPQQGIPVICPEQQLTALPQQEAEQPPQEEDDFGNAIGLSK